MGTQLSLLSSNEERTVLSVTELTRNIKRSLEGSFRTVRVEGEIANFKYHSSGHMYFALKDANAIVNAVVWRSRVPAISIMPEDGMQIVAQGRITVYEARGVYQLEVNSLKPTGIGELQAAFEKLKRKLYEEGLFDEEDKKPLPQFPERIGIVTSPTGAALHDIVNILRRRFPSVEVIVAPVPVQGAGASVHIANAIRDLNEWGRVDVIILARGGGAPEDLWAFNEEKVARAIYASDIPVVSAVGHEIDFTIADFVADLRAPTPSAAAELVVRDRRVLLETLQDNWYHIEENVNSVLEFYRERIQTLLGSYSFNRPIDLLRQYGQRVDDLERSITSATHHKVSMMKANVASLRNQLIALDPNAVLRRGFAIVRKNGAVVSSVKKVAAGDELEITMHDGTIGTKVI